MQLPTGSCLYEFQCNILLGCIPFLSCHSYSNDRLIVMNHIHYDNSKDAHFTTMNMSVLLSLIMSCSILDHHRHIKLLCATVNDVVWIS